MVTGPWVAHLMGKFESSLRPLHKLHVVNTHHGQGWGNQTNFGSHVQLMAIMIEMMRNQFIDINPKEQIEDESVEIVKQIEDQTRGSVKNCKKSIAP